MVVEKVLKKKAKKVTEKGKLIVLDGIDGSGKATQTKFLEKSLKKEGFKVKTIDFPRYRDNFMGAFIGECLTGKHGDFLGVNPKIASVLYATDRFESSNKIREWLNDGYVVITDRYVTANQIHQGGKISNEEEREEFMVWLEHLEYKVFGIPKPDIVIYLDVPFEVSREWLKKKVAIQKKDYLQGNKDVAEENLKHLEDSRNTAVWLSERSKKWHRIECCQGMMCMLPEAVSEEVVKYVLKKVK